VEFYSSSVSKELKGEEETGRRRLDRGNEEGGAPVWFGYSHAEEGDDALVCCIRPKGRAEWVSFGGSEGEMKMGRAMKWAESQGGCSINSLFFVF
jgi:hypothetical protein